MGLKQILPGHGQGGGGTGDPITDEQLEQIGGVANDAKTIAQSAKTESAAAGAKADEAKAAADGYSTQITTATQKADAAKTAADAASAAAAAASGKADGVAGTAADAKTKAEAAQSAAATAGTKADAAKTTADGLDSRVTVAENKATAAKTAADAATAAAGTASSKADAAKTAGDNALAVANGYESRLNDVESTQGGYTQLIAEATATANEANTAALNAKQVAEDLDDAVIAAGTKADTAKTAADAAAVAAAEAKVTAGQANTKATDAKAEVDTLATQIDGVINTAETAVEKAEEAKTLATQVGTNVTDIQNDVATLQDDSEQTNVTLDDLSQRMLTAETDIDALQAGGGGGETGGSSLPLSHWLSVWGDSRTEQNWNSARNAINCRGYAWWAEVLSRRVRVHKKYNFGLSGDDISQLYARMTGDVANDQGVKPSQVPPGPAVLFIGTNSIIQDLPLATLMSQLQSCINWLKSKGHLVFVVADYPRGLGSILSVNEQKLMASYVDSIRNLSMTDKEIRVIDVWPYAADPSVSTCIPLTGMVNADGLHPSPAFGFVVGRELAQAFKDVGMRKIIFPGGGQGLYDSVLNPKGNLIKNPNFSVTKAANGTNMTGVVPSDWTLTLADTGLSLVGSVVTVTLPDGTKRKAWRAVITGTSVGDFANLQVRQGSLDVTRFSEGDIAEGHFECMVQNDPVNLISTGCHVATNDTVTSAWGGFTTGGSGTPNTKDSSMPDDVATGFYGVSRSPEYVHQTLNSSGVATTLAFECRPYFGTAGPVNVTIDFISSGFKRK